MPGPLAAQLAMYLGYVHHGVLGATLVGIAFVLPSFLMVLALGWAYVTYGGLAWMQSVFYGVGASVIGIILLSAIKLTRKTIGQDWLLWLIYLASATVTVVTESEKITLFLGAGLLFWLVRTPPSLCPRASNTAALLPVIPASGLATWTDPSQWPVLIKILVFFTKAGAFVFGS